MATSKLTATLLFLTVFLCEHSIAQDISDTATVDFYNEIKSYDLATVFMADSFIIEGGNAETKVKRKEPLGFIGDNYQRFYIHFISATKNKLNPNEYLVSGKTKVKTNICDFQGSIKIITAKLYKHGEVAKFKQGFAICSILLNEDKTQLSTGSITGKLKSNFIIDDKQRFRYDAIYDGDDFSNNDFEGSWTSYKSNIKKICKWGDYRIPNSLTLDSGAAEFMPDDKYSQYGWQSYLDAYFYEKAEVKKEEERQWWK